MAERLCGANSGASRRAGNRSHGIDLGGGVDGQSFRGDIAKWRPMARRIYRDVPCRKRLSCYNARHSRKRAWLVAPSRNQCRSALWLVFNHLTGGLEIKVSALSSRIAILHQYSRRDNRRAGAVIITAAAPNERRRPYASSLMSWLKSASI